MLRFLYSAVVRAHPPYFRQRFSDEMQAIFDQADTELTQARLLADAVFSLVRQWMLRPQFWEEPTPIAAEGGTLLFSSLATSKPRTVALFSGAILSALVLNGVSLTIGYAWEHPIFIEIRRPTIVPPAAWKVAACPEAWSRCADRTVSLHRSGQSPARVQLPGASVTTISIRCEANLRRRDVDGAFG